MIDLPCSQPLYQRLLSEETSVYVIDLNGIDQAIAKTVTILKGIVHKKVKLDSDRALSATERQEQMSQLPMDGCHVEDLCLDFTNLFSGMAAYDQDGQRAFHQFVTRCPRLPIGSFKSLTPTLTNVREGFNSLFPITSLGKSYILATMNMEYMLTFAGMFYPDELDQIFCGTVQSFIPWDFKVLSESCKPDHGYNMESDSITNLFSIMAGYDQDEQRAFLQFVTGCPRLPIGSFKSLTPPLTIVKKTFDTPEVRSTYFPHNVKKAIASLFLTHEPNH